MALSLISLLKDPNLEDVNDHDQNRHLLFISEVNEDITALNHLIQSYNLTKEVGKKLGILNRLSETHQNLRNKYPPSLCAKFPDYELFYQNTLKSIRGELRKYTKLQKTTHSNLTLGQKLQEMSQDEINLMVEQLLKTADKTFEEKKTDEMTFPIFVGNKVLWDHSIELKTTHKDFGNSYLFKITPPVGEPFSLRLEKNRESGTAFELALRDKPLLSSLTKVYAKRDCLQRVTQGAAPATNAVSLWLGEWCEKGNVLSVSKSCSNDRERLNSGVEIYRQTAQHLYFMQKAGYSFMDLKNTNLVLTDKGIVRISDAKSLMCIQDGHIQYSNLANPKNFNPGQYANRWNDLHFSPHIAPREFSSSKWAGFDCESDPALVYMLALNLYQFLTQCDNGDLRKTLDFNKPIFTTPEGQQLQQLIEKGVSRDPQSRGTVSEMMYALEKMQPIKQQECQKILRLIRKTCSYGSKDQAMAVFFEEMQGKILACSNDAELKALKKEIATIYNQLHPVTQVVQNLVQQHLKSRDWLGASGSHKEKGIAIEEGMRKIPIKDRIFMEKGSSLQVDRVLDSMGKHRPRRLFSL